MAKRKAPWSPKDDDSYRALLDQNPWWDSKEVPGELAPPVRRALARALPGLLKRDKPRRFHLILGPRRVGKTTAMYQAVADLLGEGLVERPFWLRLDHPMIARKPLGHWVELARELATHSKRMPALLFLDELTYAEEWDRWLKTFYDEAWPVRIVATSSSTAALKTRRRESGVGRWEEHYLAPYLYSEYLDLRNLEYPQLAAGTLEESLSLLQGQSLGRDHAEARRRFLLIGGFPELLDIEPRNDESDMIRSQQILRSDAVERAVYKDIPTAFGVNEPVKLERLLYILAGQIGGMISPAKLAGDLGLTTQTLEKYVGYLEQSFLIIRLPNYSPAEGTVQRRGRKLYFIEGAVRNAALLRGLAPLRDPSEMGVLFENTVAAHLDAYAKQAGGRLYYWREGSIEVDFVLEVGGEVLAFEIGSAGRHSRDGLKALAERYPRFKGRCYLVAPDALFRPPDGVASGTVPLDGLLCAVSQMANAAMQAKFA